MLCKMILYIYECVSACLSAWCILITKYIYVSVHVCEGFHEAIFTSLVNACMRFEFDMAMGCTYSSRSIKLLNKSTDPKKTTNVFVGPSVTHYCA